MSACLSVLFILACGDGGVDTGDSGGGLKTDTGGPTGSEDTATVVETDSGSETGDISTATDTLDTNDAGDSGLDSGLVSNERWEGSWDLGDARTMWVCSEEAARMGEGGTLADLDGDGAVDVALASPNIGRVSITLSPPDGGELDWGALDAEVVGSEGTDFGNHLANGNDLDGDGADDLLIAEWVYGDRSGRVMVFTGPWSGSLADSDAWASFTGGFAGGVVHDGQSDATGDGLADLVLTGGHSDGQIYLFHGPLSPGEQQVDDADLLIEGEDSEDGTPHTLSLEADFDGDGTGDLVVGNPSLPTAGPGLERGGGFEVFLELTSTGTIGRSAVDKTWLGAATDDYTGRDLDVGDLDGDGNPDVAVGAMQCDQAAEDGGCAWVVTDVLSSTENAIAANPTAFFNDRERGYAGWSLSVGDVDGDGQADLLVAGQGHPDGEDGAGAVWMFYGPLPEARLGSSDADAIFHGENRLDAAEFLSRVEDVDGDGQGDFLVLAPVQDRGATDAGTVYLINGVPW